MEEKKRKLKRNDGDDKEIIGNIIGDEGAKALSEMLRVNTTLTSLDLSSEKQKKRKKRAMSDD